MTMAVGAPPSPVAATLAAPVTVAVRPTTTMFSARGVIDVRCPDVSDATFTTTPDDHETKGSSPLALCEDMGAGDSRADGGWVVLPDVPANTFRFTFPAGTAVESATLCFRLRTTSSIKNRYSVRLGTVLRGVAAAWDGEFHPWLASCDGAIQIRVAFSVG